MFACVCSMHPFLPSFLPSFLPQGQFLAEDLFAAGYRVGFTHFSSAAPNLAGGSIAAFEVDLATGAGLPECLDALGPLVAVVNCASLPVLLTGCIHHAESRQ